MEWQKHIPAFLGEAARPLIVVLGPTASGKTSLSVAMALHINHAEIVNADSRQLYRGLDIGTAKITSKEMKGIPHHLFSIFNPDEAITIVRYKELAQDAIDRIHTRKNVPILVGGSMLYISAIIDGLDPVASSDSALRNRLSEQYDRDNGESLYRQLAAIDPESAAAIPRQNKHYLIRALEIWTLTGNTKSASGRSNECPYDLLVFGTSLPREELHRRINGRIDVMFESGWIGEVRSLLHQGYDTHAPAMESHGYREIADWIRRGENPDELIQLKETIAQHSRKYAKRQMTWWRGDPRIHWIAI